MWRGIYSIAPLVSLIQLSLASYVVVRDYSGANFFSAWNFYGGPDSFTLGNVQFLDQTDATSQGLAYINSVGNAVIRVDNSSTVDLNSNRNSVSAYPLTGIASRSYITLLLTKVRLTSIDSYPIGSLWIIDAVHIPFGCSVCFSPSLPLVG
jgi:hypothetical protein